MFDLVQDDKGEHLSNDDCDKHNDDNSDESGNGDDTSCSVLMNDFENVIIPFW